ncbi:MAG: universal stress protein [Oculatellaceae cyanobacterium Prado106]|jgi:nucleotide-binding universal stress UspA family protein|nr:universal stress protein [Oculatellaceae cyanobacterium Prado106]
MFQRLLICTDLSDGLHRLTQFVPSLAAGGVQQITFLHTLPVSNEREIPRMDEAKTAEVRDRLSTAQHQIPPGVEVNIEVLWGKPIDLIIQTAQAQQSDLILLGTPTRSLLTEKILGSTSMGLCQRISIPVMMLRPQLLAAYTCEELDLRCRHLFRCLLVPYDGSKPADYLISQIQRKAEGRAADSLQECKLYWVYQASGRRDVPKSEFPQESQAKLEAARATLAALNLQVTAEVLEGTPVPEILEAAQEEDISAIATSSDSMGKLMEISIPSFTGEILRRSWHPVIYFPPAK